MKSQYFKIWFFLIVLTIISALFSDNFKNGAIVILVLSVLKFIGVSFYFMEIKKAHIIWKASVVSFVLIFFVIIILTI
mgnify:CR=1 FL=1